MADFKKTQRITELSLYLPSFSEIFLDIDLQNLLHQYFPHCKNINFCLRKTLLAQLIELRTEV